MSSTEHQPFGVVIVGGGVAGLEAALALRDMAGDRAAITMVAPDPDFVYRPLRVKEPFAEPEVHHYPLDEIARDIGLELKQDRLQWLDAARRVVHSCPVGGIGHDRRRSKDSVNRSATS